MAMKEIRLRVIRDENTGEVGLALADMRITHETNAATEGLLIAHDVVEHVNGADAIGSIDDELEALGAIWYVRGQYSDLRRDGVGSAYTVHENIAADITRMFADFFHGAHVDLSPMRTHPTDADDDFREIINLALADMRNEVRDAGTPEQELAEREAEYIAVCLPRMRRGYRKARNKYDRYGRFAANSLFWAIAGAVDRALKHHELFEGQEFTLHYDVREGTATVEEFYGFANDE